jgi:glycosyltransferase involved in cell wall biosynthesis
MATPSAESPATAWFAVPPDPPKISVIVPARDEEASLGGCLQSLVAQAGVPFEIIVVDDGSTDRTPALARSFPGVRVIEAGELPAGWSGKNHAMSVGAHEARGRFLLFTDADTVHLPGSLARTLLEAQQRGAALLSYSPAQEVHGVWQKAVMAVIFAELAITYRPAEVNDPATRVAAANGQYLLISRAAYDAVGGHAAVRASLLEDVALARAVKASGRRIFFRYGPDAVRTRMYRSFSQLREGWTKNLVLLFRSPVRLAVLRLLEFALLVGSGGSAILGMLRGRSHTAAFATVVFLALGAIFVVRIRKAHFSPGATALALVGLPLFAYLLLRSVRSQEKGQVQWKGRNYAFGPAPVASPTTVLDRERSKAT